MDVFTQNDIILAKTAILAETTDIQATQDEHTATLAALPDSFPVKNIIPITLGEAVSQNAPLTINPSTGKAELARRSTVNTSATSTTYSHGDSVTGAGTTTAGQIASRPVVESGGNVYIFANYGKDIKKLALSNNTLTIAATATASSYSCFGPSGLEGYALAADPKATNWNTWSTGTNITDFRLVDLSSGTSAATCAAGSMSNIAGSWALPHLGVGKSCAVMVDSNTGDIKIKMFTATTTTLTVDSTTTVTGMNSYYRIAADYNPITKKLVICGETSCIIADVSTATPSFGSAQSFTAAGHDNNDSTRAASWDIANNKIICSLHDGTETSMDVAIATVTNNTIGTVTVTSATITAGRGAVALYDNVSAKLVIHTRFNVWTQSIVSNAFIQGSLQTFTENDSYQNSPTSLSWSSIFGCFIAHGFTSAGTSAARINFFSVDSSGTIKGVGEKRDVYGLAVTSGSTDQEIDVALLPRYAGQLRTGFSGLTIGSYYYTDVYGVLTTTVTTNRLIGVAISATTILLLSKHITSTTTNIVSVSAGATAATVLGRNGSGSITGMILIWPGVDQTSPQPSYATATVNITLDGGTTQSFSHSPAGRANEGSFGSLPPLSITIPFESDYFNSALVTLTGTASNHQAKLVVIHKT